MLMSLCLMELRALEPKSYSETKEIFDQLKVPVEDHEKDEVIKDANLVVQIEKKFYSFETGAPKLFDYGQVQAEQEALEAEAKKNKRTASHNDLRQQHDNPDPIVQAWYKDSKEISDEILLSDDGQEEIEEESDRDESN